MINEDAMVVTRHAQQKGVGLDEIMNIGKIHYFIAKTSSSNLLLRND